MVIVGGDGPRSSMWSEWKDNVLYVHDGDKVTTHKPLDGKGSTTSSDSTDKAKKDDNKSDNKPDNKKGDDSDDDSPMPNLFGDSGSESDDGILSLFD